MMNIKHSLLVAVAGGAVALSSTANAGFLSYYFDPTGDGGANAVHVSEYLNYLGGVYAENTFDGDSTEFTLQQWGYAEITGKDGVGSNEVTNADIFASFSGSGQGDLATGSATFTDGTLELFSGGFESEEGSTRIAEFKIIGGGSQLLEVTGAPDGFSGLDTRATYFAEGYFFKDNNGALGDDFSTLDLDQEFLFGFATGTLSLASGAIPSLREQLDKAFPGNTFADGNTLDDDGRLVTLYSAADGQFRISTVPEPATLALAGVGLLALGFAMRRRRSNQQ